MDYEEIELQSLECGGDLMLGPSQSESGTISERQGFGPAQTIMDSAYPLAFSGCLFITGGLIGLVLTTYASLIYSIFIITEAVASFLVTLLGMCLLRSSMNKVEDLVVDEKENETEQSGRFSPFYYELEPIIQKRALPPIPRDIGWQYDAVVTDKV